MSVEPFAWEQLPLARASDFDSLVAARAFLASFSAEGIVEFGRSALALELSEPRLKRSGWRTTPEATVLEARAAGGRLRLSVEPQLATRVLSHVLDAPVRVTSAGRLTPGLHGAWAATVLELSRVLSREEPIELREVEGFQPGMSLSFSIRLEGQVYGGRLDVLAEGRASGVPEGDVPISRSLVVARSASSPRQLATLRPGDIWLPGDGWMVRSSSNGQVAAGLVQVTFGSGERSHVLELGDPVRCVAIEVLRSPQQEAKEQSDMAKTNVDDAASEAILDSPITVTVELGQATLTARQWMALGPGDVLRTELSLGGAATLRVAGRAVAKGELVQVDGQLGIRIQNLEALSS